MIETRSGATVLVCSSQLALFSLCLSVFKIQLNPITPCFFEAKTIFLGFALQSYTIGYLELFFVSPESWKSTASTVLKVNLRKPLLAVF